MGEGSRSRAGEHRGDKRRARIPRRHALVAASHAALGALLLFGVWVALPARHGLVDGLGTAAAVAALGSAASLVAGFAWARRLAFAVTLALLVLGLLTVTALAWSAAYLAGLYGPVGGGGALLMAVVALLVLPYLVAMPIAQLGWLVRQDP